MVKKFCRFCAEPHERKQSTCSDECSTELIRVEFQENGELERRCLWCPVRGDLAAFKTDNCCQVCYTARKRLGACSSCGGPAGLVHSTGVGNCCPNCDQVSDVLERNSIHRAYLLVDESTLRTRVFYTSRSNWVKAHRDYAPVISVGREGFERPRWDHWPQPTHFVPVVALKQGTFMEARVKTLELAYECGREMTSAKAASIYRKRTGASQESALRYFERMKVSLRSWGISVKACQEQQHHYYEVDQVAVRALLLYFKTILKNKKMGYYWK